MTDQTQPLTPAPEGNPPGSGYFSGVGEGNVTWHPGEYPPEPATAALPAVIEDTVTMPVVPEALEPLPVFRPFPRYPIGDFLISSMPGFDIPPCGHCGTAFSDAPPGILAAVRPLLELRHLARQAGWNYDLSLIWTCPDCFRADGERRDAFERRVAESAANAEHEHRSILAGFDRLARAAMEARGWDFTCRWSYDEAAAPRWAA